MRAIENRHGSVVSYLLSLPEIKINQQNENGSTALHVAAQVGDVVTVGRLLELGAAVAPKDKNGISAHDIATANGHSNVAELINQFKK